MSRITGDNELGDVQAALLAADNAEIAKTRDVEPGEYSQRAIPPGWSVEHIDAEKLLNNPRRAKGTIKVRSAAGFIEAIKQRWPVDGGVLFIPNELTVDNSTGDGPIVVRGPAELADQISRVNRGSVSLYADEDSNTLVCILNDDQGTTAGWRDHRIALEVKYTEEWELWKNGQGFKEQKVFAEHIWNGSKEIREPSASEMLRIAEQFEATIGIDFKKGDRVRDGRQQLVYNETIEASSKNKDGGTIEIPEMMILHVKPYIGGNVFEVNAPIRYRLNGKVLTIGYDLERPADIERKAFRQIADEVAAAFSIPVIEGEAPAAR